jgi:hypothetical protein
MDEDAANTVTWGIFPGKEIVQPTIIEEVSFCAWKVVPSMPQILIPGRSIRYLGRMGEIVSDTISNIKTTTYDQG